MIATRLTDADTAYIRANYLTLDELCAGRAETPEQVAALIDQGLLPRPSYVLDDGSSMFPADYFRLVDEAGGAHKLRAHFVKRHRAATEAARASNDDLERDWQAYIGGVYGICLHELTPGAIVRKSLLVSLLCELLVLARPQSADWREGLRAAVAELDAIEREFTPDYDRSAALERLPTRDLLIKAAHERYPALFAGRAAASSDAKEP
jgi:hypothetical protein